MTCRGILDLAWIADCWPSLFSLFIYPCWCYALLMRCVGWQPLTIKKKTKPSETCHVVRWDYIILLHSNNHHVTHCQYIDFIFETRGREHLFVFLYLYLYISTPPQNKHLTPLTRQHTHLLDTRIHYCYNIRTGLPHIRVGRIGSSWLARGRDYHLGPGHDLKLASTPRPVHNLFITCVSRIHIYETQTHR